MKVVAGWATGYFRPQNMENLNETLNQEFYGQTVETWLIALGITVAVWIGLFIVRALTVAAVKRLTTQTAFTWDDVLTAVIPKTHGIFLLTLALFAGSQKLALEPSARTVLMKAVVVVGLIQVGLWATAAITFFVRTHRERKVKDDPASVTTISALGLLARLIVWILVVLLILANAGVQIGPLLAGLGVGGIAIALAVQTVLKDLLASLSIMLDKPFVVGDFLIVGDLMGAVEHIGLKTTRIRSLSGEQLVFSNNDLLESRIRNFGRMKERRAVFKLGVTYQTTREQLAKIPGIIKAAIESQKNTRFDRSHFNEYGNFSLNIETVYYLAVPDYVTYMDVQQAVNLAINEQFEKEGIEFAYPTQTIFLSPQDMEKTAASP
jgi:small-conductance mechanosensitive channel